MEEDQINYNSNEEMENSSVSNKNEKNFPDFSRSKSTWEMAKEEIEKDIPDEQDIPNKNTSLKKDNKEEKANVKKKIDKNENDDLTSKEDEPYKKEINNLKTRLHDSQKYGTVLSQGRQKAISHLNELLENGDLSEENHKSLLSFLKLDGVKQPEGLEKDEASTPFIKFSELFSLANGEGENYRNATDMSEEDFGNRILAFNSYIRDTNDEELEELYEELSPYSNNPMALMKKMIKKGEKYIEEGYGELLKFGGIRKYLKNTSNEMSNMRKKIDKLEREKLEYMGERKPTYRMDEALTSGRQDEVSPDKHFYYIRDNWHKFSGTR